MVIILAALRDALDGTERVRRTIRDLKTFARPESDWLGPVDVERVMRAATSLAAKEIRHRARLICEYDSVPAAHANESKLAQVFLSLLINAAHSIPDGDVEDNEIRVTLRGAPGRPHHHSNQRSRARGSNPTRYARCSIPSPRTARLSRGQGSASLFVIEF